MWGSMSRGTAVKGHSDVDILVVGSFRGIVDVNGRLEYCAALIRKRQPNAQVEIRLQTHSLGWKIAGRWVDIVPAIAHGGNDGSTPRFTIGSRRHGGFIGTRRPDCDHTELARDLIVFFKKWNYSSRVTFGPHEGTKPFTSFHLETMICQIVCQEHWDGMGLQLAIALMFSRLWRACQVPCWWADNDLHQYLDARAKSAQQRREAVARQRFATDCVERAVRSARGAVWLPWHRFVRVLLLPDKE
eukprot:CAMPEP_0168589986 /NCGR_PEP_ID=MMETSP0420-20121227/6311_1 /TAXON_ID=498008 /ORGANISM="Pessonella sp." /LENGTH=243 /DNA_ID=CAMNT_0008625583 /DNA_START=398 /DNA_END=1129 /DNA_ORIENTATION=-